MNKYHSPCRNRPYFLAVVLGLLAMVWLPSETMMGQETASDDTSLTVMSFNLRFGTANDGDNRWENRTEMVKDVVARRMPDLLGTQETLPFQAQFLSQQFPQYQRVGRSREPENANGEQCALFFKTDRFDLLAEGHFWLSEQPDQPGSKSWDSSLPRMVTWVRLWDKQRKHPLLYLNTHFDHRGAKARAASAELLRNRAEALALGAAVIITGDFNCGENSQPYQNLLGPRAEATASPLTLVDSWVSMHGKELSDSGTFNGFAGTKSGDRIDWVIVSEGWKVEDAQIIDDSVQGRYPSDHFPVISRLN